MVLVDCWEALHNLLGFLYDCDQIGSDIIYTVQLHNNNVSSVVAHTRPCLGIHPEREVSIAGKRGCQLFPEHQWIGRSIQINIANLADEISCIFLTLTNLIPFPYAFLHELDCFVSKLSFELACTESLC